MIINLWIYSILFYSNVSPLSVSLPLCNLYTTLAAPPRYQPPLNPVFNPHRRSISSLIRQAPGPLNQLEEYKKKCFNAIRMLAREVEYKWWNRFSHLLEWSSESVGLHFPPPTVLFPSSTSILCIALWSLMRSFICGSIKLHGISRASRAKESKTGDCSIWWVNIYSTCVERAILRSST
jgi:hypothetical protein